jgi:glycosyltransferase involved in cell wall biosynthesis
VKIVTVNDYFYPRLGYQDYFLAWELQKAGHDITVITSDRHYRFRDYEQTVQPILGERLTGAGERLEQGIKTVRLPIWVDLRGRLVMKHLLKTIDRLKPDFVHIHCYGRFHSLWLPKKLWKKGIPYLIDDHMIYSIKRRGMLADFYYKAMKVVTKCYVLPYCLSFIGVTEECSRFLHHEYGIPEEKIRTIPLGSDTDLYFFDRPARDQIRKERQLLEDDIVVSYIGKIHEKKGLELLWQALCPLLKSHKKLYLYLHGNGPAEYLSFLRNTIKKSGLENRVRWHSFVSTTELRPYFSFSDICVWPGWTSTSMLDAAACERPIIGTNSPVTWERIAYENGLAFEAENAND